MLKNLTIPQTDAASIGTDIGHDLGLTMISKFQSNHPVEIAGYSIGKDILDRILNQPLCAGLKIYNAINENGQKTLVLVGMDSLCQPILSYTEIGSNGACSTKTAIVADRIKPGRPDRPFDQEGLDWAWAID